MVSLVVIERDGRRRPVCCLCRRAKDGEEPKAGYVFMCDTCQGEVRERNRVAMEAERQHGRGYAKSR